jgi:MSHA biogenesis protein MshM
MYEQHFNFQNMPFSANPAEWQFFESESSAALLPKVLHTLQFSSGVAVVTGPEGVGKTVLLHHLHTTLSKQGQAIILPGTSLQSVDDLYVCIRRSLKTIDGQPVTTGSGRWDVVERLQASTEFWGPMRLLVDDAHLLDPDVFTELQFLLEQRASAQTLCRLLLAGSHTLEETLARPALSGFAQRIRTFTFLQPLRLAESIEYLKSQMSHAGSSLGSCFDSDAVEAIVEAADGSPRCLNLLADESLICAFHDNQARVTLATVHTALSSLQHLPHAWNVSVSNHSDAALDDTAQQSSSWQSSSDGVIEIGAPQETGCVEIGGGPAPSQLTSQPEESTPVDDEPLAAEDDSTELLEDLPALDDIATDPWLDESDDTDSDSTLDDEHDFDTESIELDAAETERSFDAGYLLADLEFVGDPAIDIDDDLDQRLLQVADAADDVSANSTEPEASDTFESYRQWEQAGTWPAHEDQPEDVIRHWKQLETSARSYSDTSPAVSKTDTESSSITNYKIEIPDDSHPEPVWPAETAGLSPHNQIPVAALTTPNTDAPHSPAPGEHRWTDGQLLSDHSSSPELSEEICTKETVSTGDDPNTGVRLRIAEITDDSADGQSEPADDDVLAAASLAPDHMFTLPIALDEVTGECAPLAHSVRELQQEEDSFCDPVGRTTPSTGGISPPVMPNIPPTASGEATAPLLQKAIVQDSDSEALTLIRPQLVSQARQILATAAPAQQLKSAAGAENSVIPQDTRPALSVTAWDENQQIEAAESPGKSPESEAAADGFRNLFTRLRKRSS